MDQYEQYRVAPSRGSKQSSSIQDERRVPIRPRESMKEILFNGMGVGEEGPQRGSRVSFDLSSGIIIT